MINFHDKTKKKIYKNWTECKTCSKSIYVSFSNKKLDKFCSPNCRSYYKYHKKGIEHYNKKCSSCSEEKSTKDYYSKKGNFFNMCKVCYNKLHIERFKQYLSYDNEFRILHELFMRIKSHDFNVTEYDERIMLRCYQYYFPYQKFNIRPSEEFAKSMFYELAFLYLKIKEKVYND